MLDHAAFAHSVDACLDALTAEELRAFVLRSVKRMDGAHRVQLAMFLGHDVASDPIDEVGGSALAERDLRAYVESCGLLRERFAAFLRENPRAAIALGIVEAPEAPPPTRSRKLPARTALLAALAIVLAFLPLAAQYVHQRGMLAGLGQISPVVPAAAPVSARTQPERVAVRRPRHAAAKPQHRTIARHPAPPAKPRTSQRRETRVAYVPHAKPHHARAVRLWKFDPRYNPYVNHRGRYVAYSAPPLPVDPFARRARVVVAGYLADLVAGNTAGALRHLGLPASADPANLREWPIVARDSHVRVVAVNRQGDGSARVEADISGRMGEYFEVFYVVRDGPATRIADRYYIPVNRTAEERAARLLAKDGHN